jgi:hypothetical protein
MSILNTLMAANLADLYSSPISNGQMIGQWGNALMGDQPVRWWKYDAGSTAADDGGVSCIQPTLVTGSGRYLLQNNGQTNPDWLATVGYAKINNKPTVPGAPSINNTPSLSIQTVAAAANGTRISTTNNVGVNYSVTINTSVSISGNSSGYVVLEVCPTNSTTASDWLEIARVINGQSGTLVIGLTLNQAGGGMIGGMIPIGYYHRLRLVTVAGTPSATFNSGQQITY